MQILKFSATWCHPCQQLAKVLKEMGPYLKEKNIEVEEYDVEENDELAEKYAIRSVPTMLFVQDDIIVATAVGMATEARIKDIIEKNTIVE